MKNKKYIISFRRYNDWLYRKFQQIKILYKFNKQLLEQKINSKSKLHSYLLEFEAKLTLRAFLIILTSYLHINQTNNVEDLYSENYN